MVRRLPAPPSDWDEDTHSGQVAPMSGGQFFKKIEAAGEGHLNLVCLRIEGIYFGYNEVTIEEKEIVDDENDNEETADDKAKEFSGKRRKKVKPLDKKDYYELLGLGHLRWSATEKDIKNAYRKMVLHHHPDKQAQASAEVNDEVFKAISVAYDTLSNPDKRRVYDSQDEFDNSIPSESQVKNSDFYQTFKIVFERNSKWSISKEVPVLGDDVTPLQQVLRFYDFWRTFKSWRDFSADQEFDLEEAESRDERRWMERQNRKVTAKLKKDEHNRIISLVNLAFKYDPRIIKMNQQEEDERRRKKEERQQYKQKIRDEKQKILDDERKKIEEEVNLKKQKEEEEKKIQVAENKVKRKKRTKVRGLCKKAREDHDNDPVGNPFNPSESNIDSLCAVISVAEFNALIQAFTDSKAPEIFTKLLENYKITEDITVQKAPVIQNNKTTTSSVNGSNAAAKNKAWSQEEKDLLTSGLVKYPIGTRDRYNLIAAFVGTRSVKEVIAQTNLAKTATAQEMPKQDAFTRFKQTKKEQKILQKEDPPVVDTNPVSVHKTTAASAAPVKPEASPAPIKASSTAAPVASITVLAPNNTTISTTQTQTTPAAETTASDPESWSADEQKLLEAAMKKYNAQETDRWDKIASDVPGRTKRDCIQRYKYLVEFFKQQKGKK